MPPSRIPPPSHSAPSIPRSPCPNTHSPPLAPSAVRLAHTVVVGAGPVGLLTALLLAQRGVGVTVLDRHTDPSHFDSSRARVLTLDARSQDVLRCIAGLHKRIVSHSTTLHAPTVTTLHADCSIQTKTCAYPSPCSASSCSPGCSPSCEAVHAQKQTPLLVLLRADLQRELLALVLPSPSIALLTRTTLERAVFTPDGWATLHVRSRGHSRHDVRARLVLACDGDRSRVLTGLRAHGADDETLRAPRGFVDRSLTPWLCGGAAVSLPSHRARTLLLRDPALHAVLASTCKNESTNDESMEGNSTPTYTPAFLALTPAPDRPPSRSFYLVIPPLPLSTRLRTGGFIAYVHFPPGATIAEHAVATVSSVEKLFALFEENFPQLDVRSCFSREAMERFSISGGFETLRSGGGGVGKYGADAGGGSSGGGGDVDVDGAGAGADGRGGGVDDTRLLGGPKRQHARSRNVELRRVSSLTAVIGRGYAHEVGAVVLLGGAAHSAGFDDGGLGFNAGVEDVGVLMAVLDEAPQCAGLQELALRYEASRDADTDGLLFVQARGGGCIPSSAAAVGDGALKQVVEAVQMADIRYRTLLTRIWPDMFYPAAATMAAQGMSFAEVRRRTEVTTSRFLTAIAVAFAGVGTLVVMTSLCWQLALARWRAMG